MEEVLTEPQLKRQRPTETTQFGGLAKKEAMACAFPLISDLLARLAVLPASAQI